MPWFQPASALASPRAARRMWPALGQTMDSPAAQFAPQLFDRQFQAGDQCLAVGQHGLRIGGLRHRNAPIRHQPDRLDLELTSEPPSLHLLTPAS